MKKSSFIIVILLGFIQTSNALTESVRVLVEFETKGNAAAVRSNQAVRLPHVEIPLEMVGVDFALRIEPRLASSLIFERDGQKYVRWILNPEDTKWSRELIKYFAKKGLKLEIKNHFIGYQTASRSYIAEDPVSKVQFSVKSSTNMTGGAWRDKKQPVGEAIDARLISDFLSEQNRRLPFKNFVLMEEPAIMKIAEIDQAVVIRDLAEIKNSDGKVYYLPGFSALHESVGAEIAKLNGSNNPFRFWTENYIKVAGRALGELAARTGMQFDSPHSQNFLVELDAQLKPTGRLVLRDMSDLYVDVNFIRSIEGEKSPMLAKFTQKQNLLDGIAAGFGPLHGNKKPVWVTELQYSFWKDVFFREFQSTFKSTSGFDLKLLKAPTLQQMDYFNAQYKLGGQKNYEYFFRALRSEGVVTPATGVLRCQFLYSKTK